MATFHLIRDGAVFRSCDAASREEAVRLLARPLLRTRPFVAHRGDRVISAISWAVWQDATREARQPIRNKRLQRRAEATARYRQRNRPPEQLTVTERNKLPWSEARRKAASAGQRKRWLNDPEGAKERSRLMNEAKWKRE